MDLQKKPSVLILAAGTSGRMGQLKAFLPFDRNRCFLEKIIAGYFAFGVFELAVVLNTNGMKMFDELTFSHKDAVKTVLNPFPERERFFSVQTGLAAMSAPGAVFLHNVDNPFVNQEVLALLVKQLKPGTYVIPVFDNRGGHPVLLSKEIVSSLVSISDYTLNLKTVLQAHASIRVPVNDKRVLVNINNRDNYHRYINQKP